MSFSDADLIARVMLHEDHNAFGELVRRYQSPVRGFLVKMTRGDSHQADDLAQETFLKVWNKIKSYRNEGKFSTWLFGIAYNEWKMSLRKRKEVPVEDLPEEPAPGQLADSAGASRLKMDLEEAMKTLTAAENAAIVLNCQNGLSHEEVAGLLESPLGTVKTNILRGKEKLRRCLAL